MAGVSEPLLLLHGFTQTGRGWDEVARHLDGERYRRCARPARPRAAGRSADPHGWVRARRRGACCGRFALAGSRWRPDRSACRARASGTRVELVLDLVDGRYRRSAQRAPRAGARRGTRGLDGGRTRSPSWTPPGAQQLSPAAPEVAAAARADRLRTTRRPRGGAAGDRDGRDGTALGRIGELRCRSSCSRASATRSSSPWAAARGGAAGRDAHSSRRRPRPPARGGPSRRRSRPPIAIDRLLRLRLTPPSRRGTRASAAALDAIELARRHTGSGLRAKNASTAGVAQPLGSRPSTPWPMPRSTTVLPPREVASQCALARAACADRGSPTARASARSWAAAAGRRRRARARAIRRTAAASRSSARLGGQTARTRTPGSTRPRCEPGCGVSPVGRSGPTRATRPRTSSPRRWQG